MSEASATTRWQAPEIDSGGDPSYLTAARLEALQQEAWNEAYQKGLAEGTEAGTELIRERAMQFDELMKTLAEPFSDLDKDVENAIVELAIAMTRQLFRREIQIDASHVVGVVREALGLLPVAARQVTVHLHPEDAKLVREALGQPDGEPAWQLVEDPVMSRGGTRVTSTSSTIDATAESRLEAVIAAVAGDERASE